MRDIVPNGSEKFNVSIEMAQTVLLNKKSVIKTTVKRETVVTEIKVDGKFTIAIGTVVRERSIGIRGIAFRLLDPTLHPVFPIVICWFNNQVGCYSVDEFAEQCEITPTRF